MEIALCNKEDFDQILTDFVDFWGDERTKRLHHPIYVYEFGNSAYVVKEEGRVIAYLFGLLSQTSPVAYVKFIGVRLSHRRKGIGRHLYEHFVEFAREHGCQELKAVTSPNNKDSVAFHQGIGMKPIGESNEEGIPVVKDYGGPGIDRVVFYKRIQVA